MSGYEENLESINGEIITDEEVINYWLEFMEGIK